MKLIDRLVSHLCAMFPPPPKPAARWTTVGGWLQKEVPLFVPCFNNKTYAENTVRQFHSRGFERIVLVDNASTSQVMRDWLEGYDGPASLVRLSENRGPWHVVKDRECLALMPRYFCLTDPDLALNPKLPEDFLAQLASVIVRENVGKAGFALDIQDQDSMRDDLFQYGDQRMHIWEWEEKFWRRPLNPLLGGDPVYAAPIDTTFALYDRDRYRPDDFYKAVRVGGRFTARHLPWFKETLVPDVEASEYARTQHFSTYS